MNTAEPHSGSGFLALYLQHQSALFAFILANGVAPADADDVMQNVAEVLWRRFAGFEPGSNFRAWAFAVTRLELRKLGDRRQRQARVVRLDEGVLEAIAEGEEPLPEPPQLERLRDCLGRLGERARALVRGHYQDGLAQAELAERLGMSHAAARTGLSRVRRQLADCIARGELQHEEARA